jgi:hypothetical protein
MGGLGIGSRILDSFTDFPGSQPGKDFDKASPAPVVVIFPSPLLAEYSR